MTRGRNSWGSDRVADEPPCDIYIRIIFTDTAA